MNKTQFNRILKSWCNLKTGILIAEKIAMATAEDRKQVMQYIVRKRMPVIVDLVATKEMAWLSSMGYLHVVQGTHFKFYCTTENKAMIVVKS